MTNQGKWSGRGAIFVVVHSGTQCRVRESGVGGFFVERSSRNCWGTQSRYLPMGICTLPNPYPVKLQAPFLSLILATPLSPGVTTLRRYFVQYKASVPFRRLHVGHTVVPGWPIGGVGHGFDPLRADTQPELLRSPIEGRRCPTPIKAIISASKFQRPNHSKDRCQ